MKLNEKGLLASGNFNRQAHGQLRGLHRRFAKRARKVLRSRNRNVFLMPGGYVVKLPKNLDGCADNEWEGSVSNTEESKGNNDYVQYARTRLGYAKGFPVVFMEFVKHVDWKKCDALLGPNNWTGSVDGGQVGFNKKGRLVAYDFGVR